MTLQQTAQLEQFGNELVGPTTGSSDRVRQQMLDAAHPTLGSVVSRLDQASNRVSGSFDSAEGSLSRRQRALGQNMSASEQRVQNRRLGLGRALSTVDARNREVSGIRQRSDIARSAAGSLRDVVEGQLLSGREFAAQAEGNREQQYQMDLAEHAKRKAAGLGAIAGIGMSFIPGGAFLAPAVSGAISGGG